FRFRSIAETIASSVGCGLADSSATAAMIMPLVQNPHCSASCLRNASWTGWRRPLRSSDSIVVIARPWSCDAFDWQDFTACPSTITVHAPQWPSPQPYFVPVRSRVSRRTVRGVAAAAPPPSGAEPFPRRVTRFPVLYDARRSAAVPPVGLLLEASVVLAGVILLDRTRNRHGVALDWLRRGMPDGFQVTEVDHDSMTLLFGPVREGGPRHDGRFHTVPVGKRAAAQHTLHLFVGSPSQPRLGIRREVAADVGRMLRLHLQ